MVRGLMLLEKIWLMKKITPLVFIALSFLACAHGQLQVSTLDRPGGVNANVSFNVFEGFAFTTGTSSYSLSGVAVSLRHNGSGGESGTLLADLYASDGFGRPVGFSLISFSTAADLSSAGFSPISFSPGSSTILSANKEYVFVLSGSPSASPGWVVNFTSVSDGYDVLPGSSWTMFAGRTFRSDDFAGGAWITDSFFRASASVSASAIAAVPESSSWASMGGAVALMAILTRRKNAIKKTRNDTI